MYKLKYLLRSVLLNLLPDSWLTIHGTNPNGIYLTFDDGPDPDVTPRLIELLKSRNVKATFFLVGAKVVANPDLARSIADNGHSIGNHSYNHKQFHKLPVERQLEEIHNTSEAIKGATGKVCKLFRAPGGRLTLKLFLRLIRSGITCVHWNKDSLDWKKNSGEVVDLLSESPIQGGDIVLLHDDDPKIIEITENILDQYQNYQFEKLGPASS